MTCLANIVRPVWGGFRMPWLLMSPQWGSRYGRSVAAVVAAAAVIGGGAVWGPQVIGGGGGDPPPAGTANIWVDTNGGTCADSASPVSYSDAAACGSLNAASATCEAGDTVLIKGGTYGDQNITSGNGRSGTNYCTMTEATGETVTMGGVDGTAILVQAGTLVIDGVSTGSGTDSTHGVPSQGAVDVDTPAQNVIIRNSNIGGAHGNGSNYSFINNDIGPYYEGINSGDEVVFDGNVVHDINDTLQNHNECWKLWGDGDVIIRNNYTYNCQTFTVLTKPFPGNLGSQTWENNVFAGAGEQGFKITNAAPPAECGPIVVRNNTFYNTSGGIWLGDPANDDGNCGGPSGGGGPGPVITGNIIYDRGCSTESPDGTTGSITFNLFPEGSACGSNITGNPNFVSPSTGANGNFDIQSGSAALGAGNPSNFPSTDKAGVTRGNPPDAGAYEGP